MPALTAFVRRCEYDGGVATRFSLIHGDLIVGNIVTDDDRMGFIDWEWAELGDVAQDLAYIGGAVYGGPDYVPMTDDLVAHFVDRYVAAMRAAGKFSEDAATLNARRAGWEACERFLTMLHTTASSQDDGSAGDRITTIRRTLAETIGSAR